MRSYSLRFAGLTALLLTIGPLRGADAPPAVTGPTVTPDGSAVTALYGSTGNSVVFTISNTSGTSEWYDLSCGKTGQVTSCSISGSTGISVPASSSVNKTVWYSMGSGPGTGTVRLTAVMEGEAEPCWEEPCKPPPTWDDTGYYNVSAPPPPAATVDLTSYPARRMDYGMSLHANFAATYAQSTVPYVSMDVARSVTLVYNEDRTSLKPFVFADVSHGSLVPDTVKLQVKVNDTFFVTFMNGEDTLQFAVGDGLHRIGGQFDAISHGLGTGRHTLDLIVTSVYNTAQGGHNAGTAIATRTTDLVILDERNSPIARGWTIAGVQRLYSEGDTVLLIAEGDGSYTTFVKSGSSFVTPSGDFSKVALGTVWSYIRTYPDSTQAFFYSDGTLGMVKDRFNNSTTFVYEDVGFWRLTQISEFARTTVLGYGPNGLAWIRDPMNRYTYVTVDANRHLTVIEDPDGVSTTFGYDAAQRLSTITDRRGKTDTLSYDSQSGKLASIRAPQVHVSDVGNGNPTTWFEPWQKRGVPYTGTNTPFAAGPTDSVDAVVRTADGVVTRYRSVNVHGQPSFVLRPYGLIDTTYFNANGQVTDSRSAYGLQATYAYDGTGFMTQSVLDGVTVNRSNGGWGRASAIWGDVTTTNFYLNGANGRVDSMRLDGNNALMYRYTYDSRGRVLVTIDPEGDSTRTWYAGTNANRSKDSLPGGRVTTYGYDVYGRDSSVTQAAMPTRRVVYDLINRPIASYDGVNATPTQFAYDSLYVKSVTDPTGQVYQYVRDALGRVVGQVDPTGRRDSTAYGWMGEVRRYVNRRGQAVTLAYDSLLRRTVRQGDSITPDTLQYSANGRIVTGRSETSIETEYLNERGQPDSVKTVFRSNGSKVFWRRYSYDERARVTSVVHTGSSVFFQSRTYDWSTDGTLTTQGLGGNNTTFGYNNDRAREVTALPGTNHTITQGFSTVHSPIDQFSAAMNEHYHFDVTQRMDRSHHSGNRQELFTYDGLGRLKEVEFQSNVDQCIHWQGDDGWICIDEPADSMHIFAYDPVGNRTDHSGTYGTGNRITAFDGCTYSTDHDGNVTSRSCSGQTVTFSWNALKQLKSYTVNGSTVNMRYDAFGRLVRQWGTPVTENYYLWDRGHLYASLDSDLVVAYGQYSYYPGTDRPHALVINSTQYFAHQDGLGNVRALTTSDKTVQRTYVYDEWGQLKGGTNNIPQADRDRVRFKGALWFGDAGVELYYMRNRWYEPKTGRFLSEDPAGFQGGLNAYTFANNNPVNLGDPSGLAGEPNDKGEEVNPNHICPWGGIYNFDTGNCEKFDDTKYDAEAARGYIRDANRLGIDVYEGDFGLFAGTMDAGWMSWEWSGGQHWDIIFVTPPSAFKGCNASVRMIAPRNHHGNWGNWDVATLVATRVGGIKKFGRWAKTAHYRGTFTTAYFSSEVEGNAWCNTGIAILTGGNLW